MVSMVTSEMIDFLRKILLATRKGSLNWETTADPDILVAPLGGEYGVRLEQVPDFESEDNDYDSPAPDHILTLSKGRRQLFSLDRRDFRDSVYFRSIFAGLMEENQTSAYNIFKELWDRAYFKASKLAEELETVNRILDTRI